ncbi:MAG TPA: hypothetical protein VLB12_01975, partial [Gemmatimonadales bacterium]|nr:hypothetical protein [Gemmatimonadales bacterium]
MRQGFLTLLILPSLFTGRLQAQTKTIAAQETPRLVELRWRPTLDSRQQSSTTAVKANDYRWEGMAIGAGTVGI